MNKLLLILLFIITLGCHKHPAVHKHHQMSVAEINRHNRGYVDDSMQQFVKITQDWNIQKWRQFLITYMNMTIKYNKKWTLKTWNQYAKLWIKGNPKWWRQKAKQTQKQWQAFWNNLIILQVDTWAKTWTLQKIRTKMTSVVDIGYAMDVQIPWRLVVNQMDYTNWFEYTSKWKVQQWKDFTHKWNIWFRHYSQDWTHDMWLQFFTRVEKLDKRKLDVLLSWNISSVKAYWVILQEMWWTKTTKWNVSQWKQYWNNWSTVLNKFGISVNWNDVMEVEYHDPNQHHKKQLIKKNNKHHKK